MMHKQLKIGVLYKIEEKIIQLDLKDEVEIETADVYSLSNATAEVSAGEKYGLLVVSGKYSSVTPDARTTAASPELGVNRLALAFVTNNLPQKLLVNFFISFNKPATPTKLFTDKKAAIEWLKTFINQ